MSAPNPPTSRSRRFVFQLIAMLFGLLMIFLIGELVFRLFPKFVNDPPAPPPYNYRVPHDLIGWVVREGYQHTGEMRDFRGNAYPLQISFGKEGFRKWGDPNSSRKKVLFIGDSYTACAQTSDDKIFYKILGDSLPIEIFAYGAAGFSNTQEYLIAEHYLPEIKPDLVVWQMCSNDFMDNYWELEKAAAYHVRMRRPYTLEDGSITHQLAVEWPRTVKPYSHFLYFILKRVAELRGTFGTPAHPAEQYIGEQNLAYEPYARSVRMTDAVYKKMKTLTQPNIKLLVFDADSFNPQYNQFAQLCADNGLPFAAGLDAYLRQAEAAGECTRTDDGYHWNDRGNQLVAAFLKQEIEKQLFGNH
ncbi:MAG: SGNH/GDSL hydrolase family protein [Saprospiraceae bacterium]|nr:SGNH/GDSL hydrolase family protein [Saprospiraceae bacterium]